MPTPARLALCLMALALAACADRAEPPIEASAAASPAASRDAGAAAPPEPPAPAGIAAGPMPASGAITFSGFGPAKFGATEEEVRMAWGKELVGGPVDPQGCYYLFPEPHAQGRRRLAFMFENQRFVRLDVDIAGIAAPAGGEVGMDADAIRALYPGIAEQPHKYVEGARNLRHEDAGGSVIVFETDPAGTVVQWRVGVPPQVDYVEGCG